MARESSEQTTPTLTELIRVGIENRLIDVNVGIPGTVQAFQKDTRTADVLPAIKRRFANGRVMDLPVIPRVPVHYPVTKNSIIYFPLAKGDPCWIKFSQRSIDIWKREGGQVDPQDPRKFDISDAVCEPGCEALDGQFDVFDPDKMCIQIGESLITASPSGKIRIGQKTLPTVELVAILSETLNQLSVAQTAAGPLLNAAAFVQLKALLDQMKEA